MIYRDGAASRPPGELERVMSTAALEALSNRGTTTAR
jgi:hypothetical protein